jgi:hypothetical protein
MLYKTIVLELLQQRPALHERLRRNRMLLAMLEQLSRELKVRHEAVKTQLAQSMPQREAMPIASEAMEIALQDLEDSLPGA